MNETAQGQRGILREPLLHFLAIGALLFLAFNWRGAGGAGTNRIVITPGQIDAMVAGFTRTWQRPPSEQELKGLLDDYVREEMATREAMALGLDRDDTIIRRRLRQKLEFAAEDAIDAAPATDAELQAWLDAHAATYRTEPELSFVHVFLSPDKRGEAADGDARTILARLADAGPEAATDAVGDSLMVPRDVPRSSRTDVARQFGEAFADAVLAVEPGRWSGPVDSGFGLHLVYVRERVAGRAPALDDVRPLVERDFLADRRKQRLAAMYESLLRRHRVVIDSRATASQAATAEPGTGGGAK